MNNLIIFFFLLFSINTFGQATTTENFCVKVKFDKEIPIEKLKIFYMEKSGNDFISVNYRLNISENEIEIFGENHYVIEVGFPAIIFSLQGVKIYEQNKEMTETLKLFYLISNKGSFDKSFDKELKFSLNKPNIKIDYDSIEGKLVYQVEYISDSWVNSNFKDLLITSNTVVKINPLK
ncbi:hypothetical protein [Elizabethkingia meningoseptica]|uniref:hypothetical protein n=1 Tax=Elizabethkingia meningoseptica TaxID=238 RepID=UPI001628BC66|nr:hypothetical protein [Elizabethkingia meningoseptica]